MPRAQAPHPRRTRRIGHHLLLPEALSLFAKATCVLLRDGSMGVAEKVTACSRQTSFERIPEMTRLYANTGCCYGPEPVQEPRIAVLPIASNPRALLVDARSRSRQVVMTRVATQKVEHWIPPCPVLCWRRTCQKRWRRVNHSALLEPMTSLRKLRTWEGLFPLEQSSAHPSRGSPRRKTVRGQSSLTSQTCFELV